MLEINQTFGREVFPPSMIIKDMNLSGKAEAMEFLKGQEEQMQHQSQHNEMLQQAVEDAKLKELYSKAAANIATARERHGRAEADIGLFEERLSEISHNRALATKAKTEALAKLMEVVQKYGELEAHLKMNDLNTIDRRQQVDEDAEKADAKRTAMSNDFVSQMLAGMGQNQGMGPQ
jgi:hypothetical protein